MPDKPKIAVIGAGPAGMMAALQAARAGAHILLFDGNPGLGRKLTVTGSGRCNITNSRIDPGRYSSADGSLAARVLERFGYRELINFLQSIAVPVVAMPDGWCYPSSGSAAAVVAAFAAALEIEGVEQHLGEKVSSFHRDGGGWQVTGVADYRVDCLVIAAGGSAQPNLGSRGDCFPLLIRLGHKVLPSRPALAPVTADMRRLHKLQGVRMDVGLQLWQEGALLGESVGNAIFSQWGLNGPAAMDLSYLIGLRPAANMSLLINFITGAEAAVQEQLARFAGSPWPAEVILSGVLPPKVAHFVLQSVNLTAQVKMQALDAKALQAIWSSMTSTRIQVQGTRGLEFAQVSAGGVAVTEIEPSTMASLRAPALFLAGEVLDVVGPCGGYNLQFAFSSGALAGLAAANPVEASPAA